MRWTSVRCVRLVRCLQGGRLWLAGDLTYVDMPHWWVCYWTTTPSATGSSTAHS